MEDCHSSGGMKKKKEVGGQKKALEVFAVMEGHKRESMESSLGQLRRAGGGEMSFSGELAIPGRVLETSKPESS